MKTKEKYTRPKGMELFDIKPIILGGDPLDKNNKTWLNRAQHIAAVRHWNKIISELRSRSK